MAITDNKTEATNKITESVRDLFTLKIQLPLGNPNLSLVHTNQFLFTKLPVDVFTLANMKEISNALDSSYSRFSGYEDNRWYIEGLTITNDGNDAKMELELNPFATPMMNYRENKLSYMKAWEDAQKKNEKENSSTTSNSSSGLKGGEGKVIDGLVEDIVGDETDEMKKAKLLHEWLRTNLKYSKYANSRTKTPEQAYNRRRSPGINCADTSRLTASMFRSAGLDCFVVHAPWHYYTVFTINGEQHCSDATSSRRHIDQYWLQHHGTVKFKGKSSYYAKCGKNPCS